MSRSQGYISGDDVFVDQEVRQLIDSLEGVSNWKDQQKTLETWTKDQRVDLLVDTARSLSEQAGADAPIAFRAIRDNSIRALALMPGKASASATLEFARDGRERRLASMVAFAQPVEVIEGLVSRSRPQDEEFLACLVQEAVTRHGLLDGRPIISFWSTLSRSSHPLTWLPLRLANAEGQLPLRRYAPFGESFGMPFGPEHRKDGDLPPEDDVIAPSISSTGDMAFDMEGALAAVRDWRYASNGQVACRAFGLDPTASRPLGQSLVRLDLECLAGSPPPVVRDLLVDEAFRLLFAAAASGGAYTPAHSQRVDGCSRGAAPAPSAGAS
jgi:hypothetical protein